HPSLVAPGTNIVSLRSAPTVTGVSGIAGADAQRLSATELPYYTTATGTSFSAPQVAGAVALMLEVNPNLAPADVKDILSRTATPLPRYFFHEVGAGMLNTYAAVLEAAFPERHMGGFRSTLSRNAIRFVTRTSQTFEQTVFPFVELATFGNTVCSNVCDVRVTNRMALRESVERNPPMWRSGNAASSTAAYVLSIPAPTSWKKYRGSGVAVRLRMSLTSAG